MTIQKVELHTHLEGTIRPHLAQKLAERNKLPFAKNLISADQQSYIYKDFLDFLHVYDLVAAVIKKPEDYYDITYEYLKENAAANAIYTEMMYSPDHAEKSSNIPSAVHLEAIQQAINDAEEKFNITGRIIITGVRHFGTDAVFAVAKQAIKEKSPCIVGFGLGGDEAAFPPHLFIDAYQIAAAGGLNCTIHAGEFAAAETMIDAIDKLPVKRIGHGINAIHSIAAMEKIKKNNIALELCPSSNICLNVIKNYPSHPLPAFLKAGINISISTDDPPFFSTNLETEYLKVQNAYQYSEEQMQKISLMAIDASFVDAATKKILRNKINNKSDVVTDEKY